MDSASKRLFATTLRTQLGLNVNFFWMLWLFCAKNGMFHFWVTLFKTKVTKVIKKQKFFFRTKVVKVTKKQKQLVFLCNFDNVCSKKKLLFLCNFVAFVLKSVT
jgi:hypothetical protein